MPDPEQLSEPTPSPSAESAMTTYVRSGAMFFPSLLAWIFASKFLLPRLEWLWSHTNLPGSKLQFLVDISYSVTGYPGIVSGAILILFVALEGLVPTWPRFRRPVVTWAAVLFQLIVLVGLLAISCAVVVAAPLLVRTK